MRSRQDPMLTARGGSRAWRRLRAAVLQRDAYCCQVCGHQDLSGASLQVDHIIERRDGGPDTMENARALCKPCHARKSGQRAAARKRGAPITQPTEVIVPWHVIQAEEDRLR